MFHHRISTCLFSSLLISFSSLFLSSSIGFAQDSLSTRQAPPTSTKIRSSPFDPPEGDDHTFVRDDGPLLDTGCIFRSAGPIRFEIEVDRVVGELKSDGTLANSEELVRAGLLSAQATLIMPVFDVDSSALPEPPRKPEIDIISFNGQEVGRLSGENDVWKLNSFQIPIELVKFAERADIGSSPTPAVNEIRIDIDQGNIDISEEVWCTEVDWGVQSFKAMSPILLIHGNNSDGGFFERQGFTGALASRHLLFDNSINMETSSIKSNGKTLDREIPGIVKSFGVDSAHLVVHSKGGLDSREYLAVHQPSHDDEFKFLSYTSLSTPHNGSVLADVQVKRRAAAMKAEKIEFEGFPSLTESLSKLIPLDNGTKNLTTGFVSDFNRKNVLLLNRAIIFNTVSADADANNNSRIDRSPDEYLELRQESRALRAIDFFDEDASRALVDALYQTLGQVASIKVTYRNETTPRGKQRVIATLTSVPSPSSEFLKNDTLVTIPSGHGDGSLGNLTKNSITFNGTSGRNHSSVANAGVATTVIPWIISAEQTNGDLR